MARFPAKYAPRAIPKIGAARPKIGAPVWATMRPAIPTATAIATPSASARQSIRGLVPCRSMRRAYRPKRNRSARPTRIGGIAKGAGLKRRRRHHVVATRQPTSSSWSSSSSMTSSSPASVDHLLLATHCGYIDTLASQMSTDEGAMTPRGSGGILPEVGG